MENTLEHEQVTMLYSVLHIHFFLIQKNHIYILDANARVRHTSYLIPAGKMSYSGCRSCLQVSSLLSGHHDLELSERVRFRVQKRKNQARDLQDPERCRQNVRRHTGTYQRTLWPTRCSSRRKRTSAFLSTFVSYRRNFDHL